MIRLTTALLTLSVAVATATTANASFNCNCNPNAPRCRQICFPPRHHRHHTTHAQTQPQYVIALTPKADASAHTGAIIRRPSHVPSM